MRIQHHKGFSCCVLFLDLKEAFYRVLRSLTHVAVLTIGFPWARIANHLAANLAPMASPHDCWFHFRFYGPLNEPILRSWQEIIHGMLRLATKAMCHFHSTLSTSWQRHISCRNTVEFQVLLDGPSWITSIFFWKLQPNTVDDFPLKVRIWQEHKLTFIFCLWSIRLFKTF